jgi:hypothetical protein
VIARLPGLTDHLGWVKAPSYRLASRAVNLLRAGIPVHEYDDLTAASLIVVSVPRALEERTINELTLARLEWRATAVVVVDTLRDSTALKGLRDRGAVTATLHPVGGAEDRTLIIEGHPEAIRLMQRAVEPETRRAMHVITTPGKHRLLTGVEQATRDFLPIVASVTDHFKTAGLSKQQAETLAQTLMTSSMRSYFRAGKRVLAHGAVAGMIHGLPGS